MRRLAVLLAALSLLAGLAAAPATAAKPLPRGFFGVVSQGPLTPRDFARMGGTVGSVRQGVFWPEVEPAPGDFEFGPLDSVVLAAAEEGVQVTPFVYGSPSWLAAEPLESPLRATGGGAAWAGFLAAMIARYGPRGSLWEGASVRLPIRRWQIWNEPNFPLFWQPHPSAAGYAELLKISARAIRAADPGATVVAAGLAPVEDGPLPWRFLASMYRVPGVRRAFDVAALHPYSGSPRGVEYAVRHTRRVMARADDARKPLLVSELGVASDAEVPTAFDLGPMGQARFLEESFKMLTARRQRWHLAGVDWFSWQDAHEWEEVCSFCQFSGLVDVDGRPKPSWYAFERSVARARVR